MASNNEGPVGEYYVGEFLVRPSSGEVVSGDSVMRAEPKVISVLLCLTQHAGEVVTKDEIYRKVWSGVSVSDHVLTHIIWQLRQIFGDRDVIETIPKRGYRLTVPVRPAGNSPSEPVLRPARAADRFLPAPSVLLALVIVAVFAGVMVRTNWRSKQVRVQSLAVLPLNNVSSDPDQEYFADGITEELTTDLSRIESLRVISRTSAMQFKGAVRSLPEIGRVLNVDAVVEGSVQRAGGRVRIAVQLVHAASERHLWAEVYERDLGDILALRRDVARSIAESVRIKLTAGDKARLLQPGTSDAAAYEAFLRGRHFFGLRQYGKSAECFEEAVRADPKYALAYANLAEAYGMINFSAGYRDPVYFQRRTAAAQRAMQLDDKLAEVHDFLGDRNFYGEWDWAAGESEFRRSVELDPGSADARMHLAGALWAQRRFDDAITEMKRGRALDPLSPSVSMRLASLLRDAGQLEFALQQAQKAIGLNPTGESGHELAAVILEELGRERQAAGEHLEAARLNENGDLAATERALAGKGLPGYWAFRLERLNRQSKARRIANVEFARIYTRLGQRDQALQFLEHAYEEHEFGMVWINASADWRALHDDLRFQNLLRRMNFPVE